MKKRVGIIVDSTSVSKQLEDIISLSKQSENYEITALIINNIKHKRSNIALQISSYIKRRGLKKFLDNAFFKVICKVELTLAKKIRRFNKFFSSKQLNNEDFDIIDVNPLISKSGLVYHYTKEDIKRIKELDLNLLIRGCSGILRGEILDVCPNGVISFHHADNDINRGGPPGFWEVYEKVPRTGFIIQRLKNELDGGDVLYKGFISTSWFYTLNLANLYDVSNPYFHHVLEDITSKNPKLKVFKKSPYCHTLYTIPTILQTLLYLMKTFYILLYKIYRKLLGKGLRWGVAYQFSKKWNDVTLWRSQRISNPKNRYLADPFVIKRNGYHFCFVEDFDYNSNKGRISVYKITPSGYETLGIVLEEDFHLSFPFIYEYENEIYMCPETREKKEIRVYKCVDFPTKWKFHKTLVKDVSAVDNIIFKRNDKWWLLTNIDQSFNPSNDSQLHIFSANNPLSDEWVAHENNPVITDPLVARNGGLILSNNEVYRVFQRQGFDMYGEGSGIARITAISSNEYSEEIYSLIEPKFFNGIKGTHTYNFDSGMIVIDYVEVFKKNTGA